jgi:hypothetical protein
MRASPGKVREMEQGVAISIFKRQFMRTGEYCEIKNVSQGKSICGRSCILGD